MKTGEPIEDPDLEAKARPARREVQPPVVAGSFYPADAAALRRMIRSFLDAAPVPTLGEARPFGFIVPHAGYPYSGPVAAYSYQMIEKIQVNKFVIMGSAHRVGFEGVYVMDKDAYRTPLGEVRIDRARSRKLAKSRPWISTDDRVYGQEHSIEVQIPFLQEAAGPDFSIVVILIGRLSPAMTADLARALEETFADEDVIYIASTDMSHGNYRPYKNSDQIRPVDLHTLELIKAMDLAGLEQGLVNDSAPLCGGLAVLTLMNLFKSSGGQQVQILHYADSGDATGDHSKVVGYGAAVFLLPPESKRPAALDPGIGMSFSEEEKRELLQMARAMVEAAVRGERLPEQDTRFNKLREPGAAFVTLTTHGELRGCIGSIIATEPLYLCVQRRAVDAALNDRRFVHHRLKPSELKEVEIEISVLTPPQRISSPRQVVAGRDGVILELDGHRGVFLPQVPIEQGWDRAQYLENLCRKAGIADPDCYQHPRAVLQTFEAIVFSEEEIGINGR